MKITEFSNYKDTAGKEKALSWASFCKKIQKPVRTSETLDEYLALSRDEQTLIKDVGGFVGARFKNGHRTKVSMVERALLTVDVDDAPADFPQRVEALPYNFALYSTHKHSRNNPRFRLVVPFCEPITTPEMYDAVARAFCSQFLEADWVDDASYRAAQLMFWPSVSKDGEYVCASRTDGTDLDPGILELDEKAIVPDVSKIQDPLQKEGCIGLFCRAYFPITEAMDEFLSDVYAPSEQANRYTYIKGTSANGVVIYEDGRFAYSWHNTDPAGKDRHAKNAYDLVCTHLFNGDEVQMNRMVHQDQRCTALWQEENSKAVLQEFQKLKEKQGQEMPADIDTSWLQLLSRSEKTDEILPEIRNIQLILENDPSLKEGIGGINEFSWRHEKMADLPWWEYVDWKCEWTEADESGLIAYLEEIYHIYHEKKTHRALVNIANKYKFHPIRDKLDGLEWDELERVETFFIDYFGAEDTPYVRAVTRKMFAAAVARIYEPGTKFDHVVVLVGKQGSGKSMTIQKLAYKRWFNDLATFKDRPAVEAILGSWLIEIGEMTALRKSEADEQKQFITKVADKQRMAYGRTTEWFPRQCIFIGTINESSFLKDMTGNRRWWPIDCHEDCRKLDPAEMLDDAEVDQIWAEAVRIYRAGEKLYLEPEIEEMARDVQEEHREVSFEESQILEFVNAPVCTGYYGQPPEFRADFTSDGPRVPRSFVSGIEIWEVCLGRDRRDFRMSDQRRIASYLSKDGWARDRTPTRADPAYGRQRYFRK